MKSNLEALHELGLDVISYRKVEFRCDMSSYSELVGTVAPIGTDIEASNHFSAIGFFPLSMSIDEIEEFHIKKHPNHCFKRFTKEQKEFTHNPIDKGKYAAWFFKSLPIRLRIQELYKSLSF